MLFYKFNTVVITSVQDAGDTSETVSFVFLKINHDYKLLTPTGAAGTTTDFSWDLSANKKC